MQLGFWHASTRHQLHATSMHQMQFREAAAPPATVSAWPIYFSTIWYTLPICMLAAYCLCKSYYIACTTLLSKGRWTKINKQKKTRRTSSFEETTPTILLASKTRQQIVQFQAGGPGVQRWRVVVDAMVVHYWGKQQGMCVTQHNYLLQRACSVDWVWSLNIMEDSVPHMTRLL